MSDFNSQIIEEFRTRGGKVGGPFEGAPLLLLHHRGARTGIVRVTPLMYQDLGDGVVAIFASKAGAPSHPAWFHNLVPHPDVEVEIGAERRPMKARVTDGAERERIWERQKATYPQFAEYERRTDREIPVIVLEPR